MRTKSYFLIGCLNNLPCSYGAIVSYFSFNILHMTFCSKSIWNSLCYFLLIVCTTNSSNENIIVLHNIISSKFQLFKLQLKVWQRLCVVIVAHCLWQRLYTIHRNNLTPFPNVFVHMIYISLVKNSQPGFKMKNIALVRNRDINGSLIQLYVFFKR